MSAPARSTPPILPMRAHAPNETDPRLEVIRLKKDNASFRLRTRAYRRALAELSQGETISITDGIEFGPKSSLLPLITMARYGEEHGRAPAIRFTRDVATDRIIGVELVFLQAATDDEPLLDTLPDGMAVIQDGEC